MTTFFRKFRGKKLSRITSFEIFRGNKLSRIWLKNRETLFPRKFLPSMLNVGNKESSAVLLSCIVAFISKLQLTLRCIVTNRANKIHGVKGSTPMTWKHSCSYEILTLFTFPQQNPNPVHLSPTKC